jgi:hypothetical protein
LFTHSFIADPSTLLHPKATTTNMGTNLALGSTMQLRREEADDDDAALVRPPLRLCCLPEATQATRAMYIVM